MYKMVWFYPFNFVFLQEYKTNSQFVAVLII